MSEPMLSIDTIVLDGTRFCPGPLTVVIGPNNGGKTRFLNDLSDALTVPRRQRICIRQIEVQPFRGWNTLVDRISGHAKLDQNGNLMLDSVAPDMVEGRQCRVSQSNVQSWLSWTSDKEAQRTENMLQAFGYRLLTFLQTDTRLKLVGRHLNKNNGSEGPQSVVHAAQEASTEALSWISDRVNGAFGQHLAVDDSVFAELRFCLNQGVELPRDWEERRSRMAPLAKVDEQGDGIRAFVGILAAAKTTERPVILIDEPEAFLHPPQAYLMGRAIADLSGRGHQIFVATHSSDVLRGILAGTTEAKVLRLSQRKGQFHSQVLETDTLRDIAADPVLSSTRVLDGLFYDGVVITESDGDVALYRSVIEKLDTQASIHFINSYSKQSSPKLAAPFHAMNVPCAVVVDFDILRVKDELVRTIEALRGNWLSIKSDHELLIGTIDSEDEVAARLKDVKRLLTAQINQLENAADPTAGLEKLRSNLASVRERASVWSTLKREGTAALVEEAQQAFVRIDGVLRRLGLFVVPVGEREAWLGDSVPYSRNKSNWTTSALTYLAEMPLPMEHPLRSFVDDVRSFCLTS